MSSRRFSSASPRRYAASVSSPMTCASAASATSRGKFVASPTQSLNDERKPCAVKASPWRRRLMVSVISESGDFARRPGNTNSPPSSRHSRTISTARGDRGTPLEQHGSPTVPFGPRLRQRHTGERPKPHFARAAPAGIAPEPSAVPLRVHIEIEAAAVRVPAWGCADALARGQTVFDAPRHAPGPLLATG